MSIIFKKEECKAGRKRWRKSDSIIHVSFDPGSQTHYFFDTARRDWIGKSVQELNTSSYIILLKRTMSSSFVRTPILGGAHTLLNGDLAVDAAQTHPLKIGSGKALILQMISPIQSSGLSDICTRGLIHSGLSSVIGAWLSALGSDRRLATAAGHGCGGGTRQASGPGDRKWRTAWLKGCWSTCLLGNVPDRSVAEVCKRDRGVERAYLWHINLWSIASQ